MQAVFSLLKEKSMNRGTRLMFCKDVRPFAPLKFSILYHVEHSRVPKADKESQ
jgi:hypothetical protein